MARERKEERWSRMTEDEKMTRRNRVTEEKTIKKKQKTESMKKLEPREIKLIVKEMSGSLKMVGRLLEREEQEKTIM